ncbi:unnamed protein product [Auanema sp. JU1783]|nr:unnamed protein product [Auanema sp. JU1783]
MSLGAESPDVQSCSSGASQSVPTSITNESQPAPFQMTMPPPFFNPFISPFLPQQTDGQVAQGAIPGMVFSPAQYQEMMQQYFQQMMAASSQFGQTMAFPMPFMAPQQNRPSSQASQADSVNEVVNSMRNVHIPENGHYEIPTATVAPIVPEPNHDVNDTDYPKNVDQLSQSFQDVDHEKESSSHSESDNEKTKEKISESIEKDDSSNEMNNFSSDNFGEDRKSASEDERTANLIKKQMSEIEKEVARRSQNKNIKKIDDREMAELIGSSVVTIPAISSAIPTLDEPSNFTTNFPHAINADQSALSYTAPVAQKVSPPKETLNQLRSSFNLPESDSGSVINSQTISTQPSSMSSQTPQAYPGMPQMNLPTVLPPYGHPGFPSQQFVNPFVTSPSNPFASQCAGDTASFTPEQLISAFTQEPIPHIPNAQIAQSNEVTERTDKECAQNPNMFASGLAPPPAPSHPVHRKTSMPSTSSTASWPEDNKENGEDAIWVLRDSYQKRIQREEQAAADDTWGEEVSSNLQENNDGEEEQETDRLINSGDVSHPEIRKKVSKETMVHEPAVLIEGVLFRARYLGSTQMVCESRGSKVARMAQAQEAVARVKAPDGELQPSTEIDLFISTEKIMVLNTDLQDILMDHALRTISYIADIGDLVVLMARRMSPSDSDEQCCQIEGVKKSPKVICHVFESDEASFIAQSIGQAFQVAYVEFLRANGIDDPSYLRHIDYQEVLNSQELLGDELEMFARKETQKDVVVPKKSGEPLGVVVVESGWGSMLPTVVLAHMNPSGPAARSNQLNIGDQIININGISLVGLPLSAAQENIKKAKSATAVRLTVVSTPPVVEVRIRRPDTKYQLGFSVQNGVICSLLRGGIAERGGIRVGHRIIEINGHSVVAVAHDRIVNMLATAVGEIHMKTMPTSMFRLLTGQEQPQYI